ncbi:ABC transporter ATP-binding protein [Methylobacterium sp. 17Sr1-1]|uniref:ABC transporter ATP-binding protein n=1 Tax=Methylobacterium sp. 17Sr1-1 TaxID=2202826 RepID=UPI000D6EF002|nr:ABC transporter ATP-binding protein [Methylobacterium sp. 17Sr1-1]AWN55324.1 ABC transporter [Methylobacterium sp. 17Sr1-1]
MRPETMQETGPAHLASGGRFVLHHMRAWRWHFGGLFALVVASAACGVGQQVGLKFLVDAMAGPPGLQGAALSALALFLVLIAAEALLARLTGWLACRATVGVGVDLRTELFDFLSAQSMRYFAENLAGSLGQRVTATAGNFGALVNTFVWRIIPPVVDVAGAVIVFASLDRGLTAALVALIVVVTAGLIRFGTRGRPIHRAYSGEAAGIAGDLVDTIANMWTVKAFSARARERTRLEVGFRREAAAQARSWLYLEKARLIHDVALWLLAAGILTWTLHLWSRGDVSAGSVVVVASLTLRIVHSSKDMALSLVDVAQYFGFIEETLSVIAKPVTVCDEPGAPALVPRGGAVALDRVTFSYGAGRSVLDGVTLTIPAGQKVGIVGPSGAGKSTLVHLLQRLYDVESGEIRIDGQPIAGVRQDSLRDALAVVPQEIGLLHRSVMDNIRFARPEASDEAVFAAARAASCDGFVRTLPEGYATVVGERGTRLSGGQRQRIGIARALLKAAPILLLDEATSALDTETEMAIQAAIVRLMRDHTVIAVAHRLSTLTAFDRILVVSDGRIVEDGTVRDLREAGGLFAQMWELQAEGLSADVVMDVA